MKGGAENRKKTIIAGVLGSIALVCFFRLYSILFGGSDTPPPAPAPVVSTAKPAVGTASRPNNGQGPAVPGGTVPGVEAQKVATVTSGLDPTLDQVAMLRTEGLVYSGTGRNIFSAVYTPPVAVAPFKPPPTPPARPVPVPGNTGPPLPPPLPPINLKFFGTATRANGVRQAFLLSGEDVYLASQGEVVARKYKIGTINASSVTVTDLTNNNTQTLPLQM